MMASFVEEALERSKKLFINNRFKVKNAFEETAKAMLFTGWDAGCIRVSSVWPK